MEVWVNGTPSGADWRTFTSLFRRVVEAASQPIIICGDYRLLDEVTDVVSQTLLSAYKLANPKLDRAALLMPGSPLVRTRIDRAVQDAQNPSRRLCSDIAEVRAWLWSRLDARERARVEDFLDSI